MTRKDYEVVAEIVAGITMAETGGIRYRNPEATAIKVLGEHFANFDKDKFAEAVNWHIVDIGK